MITEAGWIVIVTLICGCITTVVGLLVKRDLSTIKPEVKSVREQLTEANKFILQQGNMLKDLRDEIAMRKPSMTKDRFDKDFEASPPYTKPPK